jgi:hypothetical protein
MHGIPQRTDGGDGLTFESGSRWTQKIYSCASTVRATIKTVSFNYNGTDNSLKNLAVTNISDKTYEDEKDLPLWGVENTGNTYNEDEISLIWGLVSDAYENHANVSTIRQSSLYLPGYDAGSLASPIATLVSTYRCRPSSPSIISPRIAPKTHSSLCPLLQGSVLTVCAQGRSESSS